MSEVAEVERTELVELPPQETALQVYSTVGGLDPLIEQIRSKVSGVVYNITTAKGRAECASDAYKVAKSKTAIEKLGAALSAHHKEIPKQIDAERRRAKGVLDALQEQVRQPLTDWEEAEEKRIAMHKVGIDWFRLRAEENRNLDSGELRASIAEVDAVIVDETYEEFEAEAHRIKAQALESLKAALAVREKHEADQAELAKLRADTEARRIQDEKDQIARDAAAAATKAAEAKAKAESDAAAKRETDAKAAQAKAEQGAKDSAERQKRAEEQAEAERLASIERARQSAETARLAEIKRQDDEREAQAAAQRKREADTAHKAKINNDALTAFVAGGMTAESAKLAVVLIAKGEIPAVRINY